MNKPVPRIFYVVKQESEDHFVLVQLLSHV